MFANCFISSAKFWLTVCVAVMMSFATVTPDIHPVEPDEIACQDEVGFVLVSNDQAPDNPNKPPHDHHAHNCGSCHVHATSLQFASANPVISLKQGYTLNAYGLTPRAGPFGLFRPPRA